jgi:acyl-CoA reductase-like NAD-dependent aldehyde dehydrogenase
MTCNTSALKASSPTPSQRAIKFAAGADTVEESKGYFVKPAIIDNPPNDSRIIVEEPFGPIVPCQPYTDLAEVIERANNTTMGLGATVFGSDLAEVPGGR